MITSMIPNVENVFKNHNITNLTFLSVYNPYINYSWSQTLTVGGTQQIKDTGTAGLNLKQFFGQGCWFNGIDQNIVLETVAPVETSPIWTICFNVNTGSTNKYNIRTATTTHKRTYHTISPPYLYNRLLRFYYNTKYFLSLYSTFKAMLNCSY